MHMNINVVDRSASAKTAKSPVPTGGQRSVLSDFAVPLVVLAVLIGIEFLTFGTFYKRTGFYLDDWLMLKQLSFGPQDFWAMIGTYFMNDPRVTIRPIEALHFGAVFFFSGTDPIGWRLSNMALEVCSAFLTFLIVDRLAQSRLLGFLSAVFLLVYPIHDATHYWAVCACVSLSLTFYLTSLWCAVKGLKRTVFAVLSVVCFALSIYGYEPFLPLSALNVVAHVMLTCGFGNKMKALRTALLASTPYALVIGTLLVYQRFIVPSLTKGGLHEIHFNPALIASTVFEGIKVSSPFCSVPFMVGQLNDLFREGMPGNALLRLGGVAAVLLVGIFATRKFQTPVGERAGEPRAGARAVRPSLQQTRPFSTQNSDRNRSLALIALGAFTTIVSYTIFGLNPEYTPTLATILNRINMGAALGWSMIFAGFAGWYLSVASANKFRIVFVSSLTVLITVVCVMSNWAMGKTWEISWAVQQRTFDALKKEQAQLADVDSVILMNCPRYVNCSPVFDGTWDFQEMLMIATGRTDIKGGVVSERMRITRKSIKDVSMGFVCAEYDYGNLLLVTPGLLTQTRITSGPEFIDAVDKGGMFFGLDKKAIAGWRANLDKVQRKKAR